MLKCVCVVGGGVYREEEETEGEPVNVRQGDEEEVEMMACDVKTPKDLILHWFPIIPDLIVTTAGCWNLQPGREKN